jgi:hypothetical protein
MNLVRDVLDQQIVDCKHRKAGKVDGIALELRAGAPPRVAYLELGADPLARRLSERIERLLRGLRRHILGQAASPARIPWSAVASVDVSVNLKGEAAEYASYRVEAWLREHVIEKIPGNAHHKHHETKD